MRIIRHVPRRTPPKSCQLDHWTWATYEKPNNVCCMHEFFYYFYYMKLRLVGTRSNMVGSAVRECEDEIAREAKINTHM